MAMAMVVGKGVPKRVGWRWAKGKRKDKDGKRKKGGQWRGEWRRQWARVVHSSFGLVFSQINHQIDRDQFSHN